jgi:hypothetical protein
MNLFERLNRGQPVPPAINETLKLLPDPRLEPAQKLLIWLGRWHKDTVCMRDIRIYGPHTTRKPEDAIRATKILVQNGWLTPIWQRRYDAHVWRIVRKPIVQPNVADPNYL